MGQQGRLALTRSRNTPSAGTSFALAGLPACGYGARLSDSDLIGTHYRYGKILRLTDYMTGEGTAA